MKSLKSISGKLDDSALNGLTCPSSQNNLPPGEFPCPPEKKKENKNEEDCKIVHPYQLKRMKIKDPEYMSEVPIHLQNDYIPGFPTTVLAVGEPGSGKTNLLMNLLTRDDMWRGFFDRIYLLGPTIKSDKLYQNLHLPNDQKVTDQKEFIPKLVEWTNQQMDEVERDPEKAPKCLFIFEDITSYYHTAQTSPDFAKCFNAIRHHKATAYANIHKLKALQRTARMSCRHIMIWRVNTSEVNQVYEDYGPKALSKKDFYILCEDAWRPDEMSKKPFLYINKYVEESQRFRKCFTHIFDLEKYRGAAKPDRKTNQRGTKRKNDDMTPDNCQQPQSQPQQPQSQQPQSREDRLAQFKRLLE